MFDDGKKRGPKPYAGIVRSAVCQPGDEQVGEWTRERLMRMDARFVARVERAIATGRESRQLAAMNGANATRPR
jgi:hypothetical protein